MPKRDPRIDAFIAEAKDFAKPILTRIRDAVHSGCPAVEETLKWGQPSFTYNGKILCGMTAHKQHCHFIFWPAGGKPVTADGKEVYLKYLEKLSDLPSKTVLTGYVKQAVKLHDATAKAPKVTKKKAAPRKALPMPRDFSDALKKNKKALKWFEDFSPSHRREYIEWITEAKRTETRAKRITQAVAWLAEGKARNWKYM
jgi:uncharacterized protein YdeI (YjbR/CyaY-like superfamily)